MLSTNVQPDGRGTVQRMQTDATVRSVEAPMAIISYNKWMGGVDRGDQIRQYHRYITYGDRIGNGAIYAYA